MSLIATLAFATDDYLIWLTHSNHTSDTLTINWFTDNPSNSIVRYGVKKDNLKEIKIDDSVKIHRVEIPLKEKIATIFIR